MLKFGLSVLKLTLAAIIAGISLFFLAHYGAFQWQLYGKASYNNGYKQCIEERT